MVAKMDLSMVERWVDTRVALKACLKVGLMVEKKAGNLVLQ